MRMLWRVVVALMVLVSAGTASAQSLAGNWQGTLQAGARSLRIISTRWSSWTCVASENEPRQANTVAFAFRTRSNRSEAGGEGIPSR